MRAPFNVFNFVPKHSFRSPKDVSLKDFSLINRAVGPNWLSIYEIFWFYLTCVGDFETVSMCACLGLIYRRYKFRSESKIINIDWS